MSQSVILTEGAARLLDPVVGCFTPEVAKRIVELRADRKLQARINELADKSNQGSLTSDERAEYATYVETIDFIAILQAKARELLQRHAC